MKTIKEMFLGFWELLISLVVILDVGMIEAIFSVYTNVLKASNKDVAIRNNPIISDFNSYSEQLRIHIVNWINICKFNVHDKVPYAHNELGIALNVLQQYDAHMRQINDDHRALDYIRLFEYLGHIAHYDDIQLDVVQLAYTIIRMLDFKPHKEDLRNLLEVTLRLQEIALIKGAVRKSKSSYYDSIDAYNKEATICLKQNH